MGSLKELFVALIGSLQSSPNQAADRHDEFQERAAILEYEAGFSRQDAEKEAERLMRTPTEHQRKIPKAGQDAMLRKSPELVQDHGNTMENNYSLNFSTNTEPDDYGRSATINFSEVK